MAAWILFLVYNKWGAFLKISLSLKCVADEKSFEVGF